MILWKICVNLLSQIYDSWINSNPHAWYHFMHNHTISGHSRAHGFWKALCVWHFGNFGPNFTIFGNLSKFENLMLNQTPYFSKCQTICRVWLISQKVFFLSRKVFSLKTRKAGELAPMLAQKNTNFPLGLKIHFLCKISPLGLFGVFPARGLKLVVHAWMFLIFIFWLVGGRGSGIWYVYWRIE